MGNRDLHESAVHDHFRRKPSGARILRKQPQIIAKLAQTAVIVAVTIDSIDATCFKIASVKMQP